MADELEQVDAGEPGQLSEADFSGGGAAETPAASPSEAAAPEMTIRSLVGSLGYQLGDDVQDDYTALVHLVRSAGEANQYRQQQQQGDIYAQLGRQLAPRAREIGQYLSNGQQAQQAQRPAYEPPPFDQRWQSLLKMEPSTGTYVAVHPNVPQTIVDAANEYREWTEAFLRNPTGVMTQFAEAREKTLKEELLPQLVQQQFHQYQTQQAVMQIAQSNAAWFYARDAQGNFLPDPVSGQYKATPLGRQYLEQVRWAAQAGVADPVMRDQFARRALASEIAAATATADQPAPNNAQSAAQRQNRALPQSRPRVNPLQSLARNQRAETTGATEPEPQTISLREQLRQRFSEEGIDDQHFMSEGAFGG